MDCCEIGDYLDEAGEGQVETQGFCWVEEGVCTDEIAEGDDTPDIHDGEDTHTDRLEAEEREVGVMTDLRDDGCAIIHLFFNVDVLTVFLLLF